MKTYLECLPCLTGNAASIACRCSNDPEIQLCIVKKSMQMLAGSNLSEPPPFYAEKIADIALSYTQTGFDPYRKEKEKSTALAKRLLDELDSIPEYHPDDFESRLRLAVAGNILDFGIFADLNLDEAMKTIRQVFTKPIDRSAVRKLQQRIEGARKILYILDNCGEAVFDRVFMELFLNKVTVGVRGRNSLNDVTREELGISGYDPSIPVADNGTGIPGVMERLAGNEFQTAMQTADLIIAKGQGNFETMDEISYPASFLFLAKCPVVIQKIKAEMKSIQIRNINF
ncbi:MAG: DUF89 family protein [Lentisphaeria bacterium]|nr:DUF89 family protein [Lentisphaeria bacterium]